MNVRLIHEKISIDKPVATIGIFDGVHSGHRFIIDQLKDRAKIYGGTSVVVTLWPHPRIVLNRDVQGFKLLHSREEKIRELGSTGIDEMIIIPFNNEIASLSACEFVLKYMVDRIGVEILFVGYDNKFGKDRKGDAEGLAECAKKNKFRIEKLPEFESELGRISSTTIRNSIAKGDLEMAGKMLGYNYYLAGRIVEGNHIGRKIGFPTANVHPLDPYKLIPMNGVYAVRTELRGKIYNGMLNIGFRPTIDSPFAVKIIEAHLFNVSGDFYDEQITIHFVKRIRDEMKFGGLDELKQQLDKDKDRIVKLLS